MTWSASFRRIRPVSTCTGELIADGLVHERSSNCGINTTGQRTDDRLVTDLLADLLDRGVDDRGHGPSPGVPHPAGSARYMLAALGVHDFRVELHARACVLPTRTQRRGRRGGCRGVTPSGGTVMASKCDIQTFCWVGVPDSRAPPSPSTVRAVRPYSPRSVRPTVPPFCWAISCAVADAENRNVEVVHGRIDGDSSVGVHGIGAAAEDDAGGRLRRDLGGGGAGRDDLAVDVARTRRAISRAYWAPKSTTNTLSNSPSGLALRSSKTTPGARAATSVRSSTGTRVCSVPQSGSYARRAVAPR